MDSGLPVLCKRIFAVLAVLSLVSAVLLAASIAVWPVSGTSRHFFAAIGVAVPPGELLLRDSSGSPSIVITGLKAVVSGTSDAGLVRLARFYFLPAGVFYALFAAVQFDLLRRLFRNVEQGASFTPQTIRLVRYVGFSLVIAAAISAVAEAYASQVLLDYLCQHVSTPALRWGGTRGWNAIWTAASGVSPIFLCGLLVLALSEVFRQGLELRNDCDLTV
jgi:hypothetical protein